MHNTSFKYKVKLNRVNYLLNLRRRQKYFQNNSKARGKTFYEVVKFWVHE